MNKEVDLIRYLPLFIAEYKEIQQIMNTENPEFNLLESEAEKVRNNQYIISCDENGIAGFERLLNIVPCADDTLESRRARVWARWFTALPYTLRTLIAKLISVCGSDNFTLVCEFDAYRIVVETRFELFGQVEELENLLDAMIPCNMIMDSRNRISSQTGAEIYLGGVVAQAVHVEIGARLDEQRILNGKVNFAHCFSEHKSVTISTARSRLEVDFNAGSDYYKFR